MNSTSDLPLHDIHLPNAISWWPPAPGWWVLAFLIAVLIISLLMYYFSRPSKNNKNAPALLELDKLQVRYAKDSKALLAELSVLLRRVAIKYHGRQTVSGLTGADWVAFLDKTAGQKLFQGRFDKALTEFPYTPETEVETTGLVKAIRIWINQQGKNHV